MVVMDKDGDIFDERRVEGRRKASAKRRKKNKEVLVDRREGVKDRRVGDERRQEDINK